MVDAVAELRPERKGVEWVKNGVKSLDEFKREAVALLASSDQPLLQIASELEILPVCSRPTATKRPRGAGNLRTISPNTAALVRP